MALRAETVTVGTTETQLGASNPAQEDAVVKVRVPSAAANSIFVGPTGVTTTNGYEVEAGTSEEFILKGGDTLMAIATAATDVSVFESSELKAWAR